MLPEPSPPVPTTSATGGPSREFGANRQRPHGPREAAQLGGVLALQPKGGQKAPGQRFGNIALGQRPHGGLSLGLAKGGAAQKARQHFTERGNMGARGHTSSAAAPRSRPT